MSWSLKIGRFFGIAVYVHFTFFLLLAFLGAGDWMRTQHLPSVLEGLGLLLCIFLCVLLHEFGHALTAKRYGVKTKDIILLPIGGVARLERLPSKPVQELLVALAGPAVNVVIAIFLFGLMALFPALAGSTAKLPVPGQPQLGFVMIVAMANLFMIGFNMIPAFPMDGGRVLRSLLAMRMDYARATRIAANLGQAIAVVFALVGVFQPQAYILLFIALFVWIGAGGEASMAQFRSVVEGARVEDAMLTRFISIKPDTRLREVEELVMAGSQEDFPVVDLEGRLQGILSQADFLKGLVGHGPAGLVEDCMRKDVPHIPHSELLEHAMHGQDFAGLNTVPVFREQAFVGLLTLQNVNELVKIRTAIREHHIRKRGG